MDTVTWRDLWSAIVGHDPPISHVTSPMAAILLIYFITMLTCYILYKLSDLLVPSFMKIYAFDLFNTMSFISYGFGHGFVRKYYGNFGYFLCVVPLNTLTALLFTHGEGNVLGNWKAYLKGQRPFVEIIPRMTMQILAGLGAWRLGLFIYNLDFFWHLPETAASISTDCQSFLNVSVLAGFLLEMSGVTFDHWMASQHLASSRPVDIFLKFVNTASVVCFGSHLTGMFMHPSMASGLSFACGTTPIHHHVIVYWAGPFIGIYLSIKLSEYFVLSSPKTEKPTTQAKEEGNTEERKESKDASKEKTVRRRQVKK